MPSSASWRLRRRRVIPGELVSALWRLAAQPGGIDPRQTVLVCQQHPSTLGTVVRAALQKLGRPNSEMEAAVAEASEREATRLYANVRWQNLAFNLAPMLGLLGTIRGVIVAFHGTANLPANMNKTVYLADGIYQALVNTFAGIAVAVPAAIFAHLLEGRIMKLMTEVDDFVRGLLPQLERFEGRTRAAAAKPPPAPPSEAPNQTTGRPAAIARSHTMAVRINKGTVMQQLPVVPLVDTLLNLLIFFLVTTKFAEVDRAMEAALADADAAKPVSAAIGALYIDIDAQGRCFAGGGKDPVSSDDLYRLLKTAWINNPQVSATIRADKRCRWQSVFSALNVCKKANIRCDVAAQAARAKR